MTPDHRVAGALRDVDARVRRSVGTDRFGLLLPAGADRMVLYVEQEWGRRAHAFAVSDLPPAFATLAPAARRLDPPSPAIGHERPFDALVVGRPAGRVVISPLASRSGVCWARTGSAGADDEQLRACTALGDDLFRRASGPEPADEGRRRLERLDLVDRLLPALDEASDADDILARAAAILERVLPHDQVVVTVPPDQPVHERWLVVDDLWACPADDRPAGSGHDFRAALRVPVGWRSGLVAGLTAFAREPRAYSPLDVFVAARVAAHAGLVRSHARLAAETARLRDRATVVERLDNLLVPLATTGSLRAVFDQISAVAKDVLAHDGLMLPVRIGDGQRAILYAASGMGDELPETIEVPPHLIGDPDWDYDIVDDMAADPHQSRTFAAARGYRSQLRLSVRLDGQFAGALCFVSRAVARYSPADLPLAGRMRDRLALAVSRERREEASKRADEATERASRLESRVHQLSGELDARTGVRHVLGQSPAWREVLTQATRVADTNATVLLLGESGTGKEVVARFLHRASRQAGGPFIALNCAALPEHLLEAELFGYERGAFTGATQSKPGQLEQAAGGTLFLDEVAEMSVVSQAKLLRVLQEREFQRLGGTRRLTTDARVIAATNRNLEKAMAHGQFREDLFYRLNVFSLQLPPLRERPEDVLPLAEAFISDIGHAFGRPAAGLSREARQGLMDYRWPGNVRELRNVLERAAILCDGGLITSDHLALRAEHRAAPSAPVAPLPVSAAAASGPPGDLQAIERGLIETALNEARFNKSKAARSLGLTRAQLYVRLRRHGLT